MCDVTKRTDVTSYDGHFLGSFSQQCPTGRVAAAIVMRTTNARTVTIARRMRVAVIVRTATNHLCASDVTHFHLLAIAQASCLPAAVRDADDDEDESDECNHDTEDDVEYTARDVSSATGALFV